MMKRESNVGERRLSGSSTLRLPPSIAEFGSGVLAILRAAMNEMTCVEVPALPAQTLRNSLSAPLAVVGPLIEIDCYGERLIRCVECALATKRSSRGVASE